MATEVDTFYPSATEQDFTASGELDIRKLVEAIGAANDTTIASFGTAAAEIILHPYDTNSTPGTANAPNYGWAINRLGADGMEATATEKRRILAGNWVFNGRLGALATLTSTYRVRVRVYRVDSAGARTLLFGPVDSATVSPSAAGNDVSITTAQSQIILEANQTILVSYAIEKTNTSLLAEAAQFRLNDLTGNDATIAVPTPGVRTDYLRSHNVTETLTAIKQPVFIKAFRSVSLSLSTTVLKYVRLSAKSVSLTLTTAVSKYVKTVAKSVSLTLASSYQRAITAYRSFPATLSLSVATNKYIKPVAKSVSLSLSTAFTRTITAYRSFSASLSLATAVSKYVKLLPKAVSLTLTTAVLKCVKPTAYVVSLTLTTAILRYVRLASKSASLTLIATAQRTITAYRSFSSSLSLSAVYSRSVIAVRGFSSTLNLATAYSRTITAFRTFIAPLSLSTSVLKYVRLTAKATSLSLAVAYQRTITAYRTFTAPLSLSVAMSRSVIAVRQFSASLSLLAEMFIKVKQDILNRIKKVAIYIFDD